MAVNKNFIVRNGLEVDENLIFADADTQKVGIGTTTPECELTVAGKICGDRAEFSGIVTASGFFQGAILGTDIDANNLDVTGISTLNNVEINGLLTAGGTTGQANYYLANTGAGITWKSFQGNVVNSVTFTATEGQSLFTLDYEIGLIEVYLNGVRLTNSEFSALNGSTVTLLDPTFDGDTVDFVTYSNAFDFLQLEDININTTGIITASSFVGDGSGLTNVIGTGSGIGVQDDGSNVGTAQTINFGSNLTVSAISSGLVTVTASGGGGIGTDGSIDTTGIITASKLHVDSVGSGITFAEDLVVQGDARVTGILSIGTSSIVLDSNAKVIRGVDEIHIGTASTVVLKQKSTGEIEFVHSDGVEASVGIGSTANINTTGIITASSFVGDGSGLTIGVEDLDDFALNLNTSITIYSSVRQNNGTSVTSDGQYRENVTSNYNSLIINWDQADGSRAVIPTNNGTIWLSADGINYSALTIDGNVNSYIWSADNQGYIVKFDATNWSIYTGLNIAIGDSLYWANSNPSGVPVPLADGDILQYESVSSKFRPARVSIGTDGSINTTGIITASSFVGDGSGLTNLPSGGGGGSSFFVQNATGIHTLSNVGIGTTNATETLTVDGTIGMPFGNVLIGGYNVGSSLQPDVGAYAGTSNVFIGQGQLAGMYAAGQYTTTGSGNVFVGPGAGQENTTGNNNVFIGSYAGEYATTGSENICMGSLAGNAIDGTGATGGRTNNIFMGLRSGVVNTTGNDNIFLGQFSGTTNTTGANNVFIGDKAGEENTVGVDNIFIGDHAGNNNTNGSYNVFIGHDAGRNNTTGQFNQCIGKDAGRALTSGEYNTFIGLDAGTSNTIGSYNVFIGLDAGTSNTTGRHNTFIGQYAGKGNVGGSRNFFVGEYAGQVTTSSDNVFLGGYAGRYNTSGGSNTFIGLTAGKYNTTGNLNIFIGESGGYYNTEGATNIFMGMESGYYNTSGDGNIFLGLMAARSNTTGSHNFFMGRTGGYNNTTGSYNFAIGRRSAYNNTTGNYNIFFGSYSGISQTASRKIIIGSGDPSGGFYFDSPNTTSDTQFAVGVRTDSNPSKYWLVGDENFNIGINSTAPTAKLDVLGDVRVGNSNSQGIILTSPNGTQYRLVVANDGTLSTSAV